jgi:hypothetical protein
MKKAISAFVIVMTVSLIFGINSYAQKKFKGTIIYTIAYSGTIDAATAAQQPKTQTVAIYENKLKTSFNSGGANLDIIMDGDSKTRLVLIDAMGQKMYYKQNTEEIDAEIAEKPEPVITYSDETKTIAGYVCKKAEYVEKEDDKVTTSVIYYTEDLGGQILNYGDSFNKLKGVALESVTTTPDGIIVTLTATEVKKGKVKDTDFLLPDDYVELSADQKQQIIDQMKGEE